MRMRLAGNRMPCLPKSLALTACMSMILISARRAVGAAQSTNPNEHCR